MPNLKEKLERLNRLKGVSAKEAASKRSTPTSMVFQQPDWPAVQNDSLVFPRNPCQNKSLEACLPGKLIDFNPSLGFLKLKRPVSSFWNQYRRFSQAFHQTTKSIGFGNTITNDSQPDEWCFMDIETCGFSNCPVFLIGVLFVDGGEWFMEQYFARDYDEESKIVEAFWKVLNQKPILISFNGKRFDVPFILERSGVYELPSARIQGHVDLYYICRKFWKGRCKNFKLQTLETQFCRRIRVGDIPGGEIPEAYHDYVANPSLPQKMADAIHHNALDLVSMAELINIMATGHACIGTY